jgi:hypothetical protein
MKPGPESLRVRRSIVVVVGALACAASATACIPKVRWDTTSAADFVPSGHTVSVFGVYKDGQMSSEGWDVLRPRLEPFLGGRECEIAGGSAGGDEGSLSAAIADYAQTNGPTEDLLAQLAPAAEGDLILVLVEAGKLPPPDAKVSVVNSSAPGPSATGTKGSAGFSAFAPDKRSAAARDVLQLSASLFSVAQGKSVALLDMQYSGDSIAEAESTFSARVGRLLPAATCKGWNWRANVDPERIRKLAEQ